jgi:hypothetical protein
VSETADGKKGLVCFLLFRFGVSLQGVESLAVWDTPDQSGLAVRSKGRDLGWSSRSLSLGNSGSEGEREKLFFL